MLPVYVVSLPSALARRVAMKAHLETLGIAYELVDAVRGAALSEQARHEINPAGNMSPGQIGCYVSHANIYERMVAQETPLPLVLEDDAVLHDSAKALIAESWLDCDFDYCFLGCDDSGDAGFVYYDYAKPLHLGKRHLAYPLSSGPYCLHAYLITLSGAKRRLACAYPARSAIDHYHHLPYTPCCVAVVPMVAFVNELSAVQSMSSLHGSGLQSWARQF